MCSPPAGAARRGAVSPKRDPAPLGKKAGSGSEGAASTEGSTSSPLPSRTGIRRDAWRLRSGQRGLVYDLHRSLACCGLGRKPIPGCDPHDALASLTVDHRAGDADLCGLLRCASPWACPVCAPKVAACRARVLAPQIAARTEAGWTAWLVTLTVRHGRRDALGTLLGGLGKAWSRLTSGRWWDTYRQLGAPEYVRGLDLTWSDRHGWHPHLHVVLLLPPGQPATAAAVFAVRWRESLAAVGFQALPGAQNVQECLDAEAAAAYATAPAAVYEALGIGTKTARSSRAGSTAFDLLRAAVPAVGVADPADVARWCEYVGAVKGRRQTTVSRGLSLSADDVLLEETELPVVDTLAQLGGNTVMELDRGRLGPDLLEAVEACAGDPDGVRDVVHAFLSGLRSRDWWLVWPPAPEPEPLPDSGPGVPWVGSPPAPPPPVGWCSPFTAEDRSWRKITSLDRAILAAALPPA